MGSPCAMGQFDVCRDLFGDTLLKPGPGAVDGNQIISIEDVVGKPGVERVGVYFSANWCLTNEFFAPTKVVDAYKSFLKAGGMEIIFVSLDQDEESFNASLPAHCNWFAMPFSEGRARQAALVTKFKSYGAPGLFILDASSGELICGKGHTAAIEDPEGTKFPDQHPWVDTFSGAMNLVDHLVKVEPKSEGCAKIVKCDKTLILGHGKHLGLCFVAGCFPKCRGFTTKLARQYKSFGEKGLVPAKFEILFISGDRSEEDFEAYFQKQAASGGSWFSLPFGAGRSEHKAIREILAAHCNVRTLQQWEEGTLVILDAKTGEIINQDAGAALLSDAEGALLPWQVAAVGMSRSKLKALKASKLAAFREKVGELTFEKAIESVPHLMRWDEAKMELVEVSKDTIKGKYVGVFSGMAGSPLPEGHALDEQVRALFEENRFRFTKEYQTAMESGLAGKFEIIFVSLDLMSEETFVGHMRDQAAAGGTWLALPFGEAGHKAMQIFAANGLNHAVGAQQKAQLVVYDPEGNIHNRLGHLMVKSPARFPWCPLGPFALDDFERMENIFGDSPCVVLLVDLCDEGEKHEAMKRLQTVAEKYHGKIDNLKFLTCGAKEQGGRIRELAEISPRNASAILLIVDMPGDGGSYEFQGSTTIDNITEFVQEFEEGGMIGLRKWALEC